MDRAKLQLQEDGDRADLAAQEGPLSWSAPASGAGGSDVLDVISFLGFFIPLLQCCDF